MLHVAVTHNQFDVARHLILRYKVDLTLKDEQLLTAFDHAQLNLQRCTEDTQNDPDKYEGDRKTAEEIVNYLEVVLRSRKNTKNKDTINFKNIITNRIEI